MFIKMQPIPGGMTNHDDVRLVENKRIDGKIKPSVNAADVKKKAKPGDAERSDGGEKLRQTL